MRRPHDHRPHRNHREDRRPSTCLSRPGSSRRPIEDVWAAVTEPERLARWIGTWDGDPTEGSVHFRMLFEGEEHAGETMEIRVCEPPRRLHVTSHAGDETWLLELDLTHADGVTTLTFCQPGVTAEQVGGVGSRLGLLPRPAGRRRDRRRPVAARLRPRLLPGDCRRTTRASSERASRRDCVSFVYCMWQVTGLPDSIGARHTSLSDQVTAELRRRIIDAHYRPGERLTEDRLAADFGVSRNPVREALRVVTAEGFIEVQPRRGAVVATPDEEVDARHVPGPVADRAAGRPGRRRARARTPTSPACATCSTRPGSPPSRATSTGWPSSTPSCTARWSSMSGNRWLVQFSTAMYRYVHWVFRLGAPTPGHPLVGGARAAGRGARGARPGCRRAGRRRARARRRGRGPRRSRVGATRVRVLAADGVALGAAGSAAADRAPVSASRATAQSRPSVQSPARTTSVAARLEVGQHVGAEAVLDDQHAGFISRG